METKSNTWGSSGATAKRPSDDLPPSVRKVEEVVHNTAVQVSEKMEEAGAKLNSALESAKETYSKLQDKTVAAAKATDSAVREYPYSALGVAFGIGLLIGVLINCQSADRSE
jgi:ElaB/YqjD/DUF883 family membrane-anchored ribosome-binding protein